MLLIAEIRPSSIVTYVLQMQSSSTLGASRSQWATYLSTFCSSSSSCKRCILPPIARTLRPLVSRRDFTTWRQSRSSFLLSCKKTSRRGSSAQPPISTLRFPLPSCTSGSTYSFTRPFPTMRSSKTLTASCSSSFSSLEGSFSKLGCQYCSSRGNTYSIKKR